MSDPAAGTVSVLVRSMARDTLAEALASVDVQTWPSIELVVVNASGRPHPPLPPGRVPRRLIEPGRPLPRAEAANQALAAATGRWLLFLDDDDTLDPGHLQRLCEALLAHPGTRVAHAGVRQVDAQGQDCGTLDEPVDRVRLWSANALAIHAVLFERALLADGLQVDESFPVYEDWDFWFQLAGRTPFLHVPGASATYRLVGLSGTTVPHDASTSQQLRMPFYRKWLPRLQADELEALAARGEHARGDLQEGLRQLHAACTSLDHARHDADFLRQQHDSLRAGLDTLQQRLENQRAEHVRSMQVVREEAARRAEDAQRMAAEARAASAAAAAAHEHLQRSLQAYAHLEQGYRAVTGSLSWRVTQPLRGLRGLFSRDGQPDLAHRLWRSLPLSNQQRLDWRDRLLGHPLGQAMARRWSPHLLPLAGAPAPAPASADDKARVRADAEASLGDFLAGDGRIDLCCPDPEPVVSVIVVLFNQAGLSRLCLQSLADSRGVSFETLIVDNASSDRMPQLLARVDGATVLRQDSNLGFLRAVNLAAARARGRHLVMLNNDAMVEPDTLRHAVARLNVDPGAGAVGGPILLWDGRLQEAGSIIWRDGSCLGYGRGDDPSRPEYAFVRDVDYCSGAFLMVRRALFEALGGLDTAYVPAYYEESDLCARLWEQGHRIVYDPRVRIRHFEFASEVASGWAIELQQKHRALFVSRHGDFLARRPEPSPRAVVAARARLAPGRQHVLVIDDRVPLPWLGQGYPRAARMVSVLAAAGHAVTHYPLQFPGESWDDVRRALPETVEVMLEHGRPGLEPFLQARRGLYQSVIVSRPHNMQALQRLLLQQPDLLDGARVIYDAEAMFTLRDQARAALDGHPWPEPEASRRIAEEVALAQGASAVLTVSEQEAAHYRRAGRQAGLGDVQVLGHEVEVVHGTPGFEARADFLFVGAMTADDTPNSDSLRWFVGAVWPRLVALLGPDVSLHLVGVCDAPSVRALAGPRVRVHGRVEDLAGALDRARVFIVPTRYAAGIPHKAHEAASRGLPMVVSTLIAGQLGWQDIVATGHDAESFAQHAARLYRDAAAWQQQRQALLAAVARDCSPQAFRQTLLQALGQGEPDPVAEPAPPPALALSDGDQRTADLWGRDAAQRADQARQRRHWSSHPVTAAEINRLLSGDARVGWVDHLQRSRFPVPRPRGLSLGCGSGAVVVDALRLGIVQQMEGIDISAGAVAVATERAAAAGLSDRARFRAANVNELPLPGPYDLIVFEQSLHHVDALGPVLDRCRDALAPDGLLVINEYVGPDRFQWSDEAERLMNAMLALLPESHRRDPDSGALKSVMQRVDPQAVIALDPSEAIHSADIEAALSARFDCLERRPFGGTLLQFLLADIASNFDPGDARDVTLLRLMALMETELIRCGAIGSDFVYAVYRRPAPAPAA